MRTSLLRGLPLALFAAAVAAQEPAEPPVDPAAPQGAGEVGIIEVPDRRPPPPIDAREPDPGAAQLDEIIVTATKREKSVREIPASISALAGEDLEEMGAHELQDYIALTPGITLTEGHFGDVQSRNITIRGVGSAPMTNQAVGQFIGDFPMTDPYSNFVTPDLDPFDLDSVEILKGPQGTYFGASALNGAIRYVVAPPQLGEFAVRGYTDWQSLEEGGAEPGYAAALNVPLGNSFALRATGALRNTPGVTDNLQRGTPDADSRRKWSARVAARWEPADWLAANVTYLEQESEVDDVLPVDNPDAVFTNNSHPGPSSVESGFSLLSADIRSDLGDFGTLVFQGSQQEKFAFIDADGGATTTGNNGIESLRAYFGADIEGTTGEVRLVSNGGGDWNWIIGAFALDYEATVDTEFYVANTSILDLLEGIPIRETLVSPRGLSIGSTHLAPLNATERAVFGELSWRIWDELELTAGVRFYETHQDGIVTASGLTGPLIGTFPVQQDDRGTSPKLSLVWKASDDITAYATISRGFQFGGVNASTSLLPFNNPFTGAPTPPTFTSSTLWNREVGIRTDWFDRSFRADLTYFNLDWTDAQFSQTQVNLVLTNVFVSNVGEVKSQGFEAALTWLPPVNGLTLSASGAYTEAVTRVPFTSSDGSVVPPGTQMPATPLWQTAATIAYQRQFGRWFTAATLTDTWSSEAYNDLRHTRKIYDTNLVNLDLSISRPDWSFAPSLSIGVTNLTDERQLVGFVGGTSLVSDQHFYSRPRALSIRFTAEFR